MWVLGLVNRLNGKPYNPSSKKMVFVTASTCDLWAASSAMQVLSRCICRWTLLISLVGHWLDIVDEDIIYHHFVSYPWLVIAVSRFNGGHWAVLKGLGFIGWWPYQTAFTFSYRQFTLFSRFWVHLPSEIDLSKTS